MPTLKGKWYFKETLDKENISTNISFSFFVNANTTHSSSIIRGYTETANYLYYYTDTQIPVYINGTWANQAYRSIEITSPTEVSEEFYNWFTKNAVNLQPTGTWRFNKTLTDPGTVLRSHDRGGTIIGTAHDTEIGSSQITHIGYDPSIYLAVYNIEADGYNIWYEGSWYSEEARVITFIDQNLVSLNPEFALWFYENAHSTELKLYSECYIAETADKIRECANDNTLTFKVSDLADGVQLAYDAGYSKGSSENSVDLEALGALCEFDWSTDSNSYPIFTVINHHPTYYLHADVSSTTNGNIFVIDNDKWSPSSGTDPLSYDTDLGTKSSTITVGPNDSYSCYIKVGLSDLTPEGMSVNTVYLKNMRWTANE